MKIKNSFPSAFIACLGLILSNHAPAQTFAVLHSFSPTDPDTGNNSEGASPSSVILSGHTLYGTTVVRGNSGYGTVFALSADGMSFTNLHNFAGNPTDGANPQGGLTLSDNTLYGASNNGGSSGHNVGTVFAVNTDSSGFTILHNFSGSDGADLFAGLILSGNILYGMTQGGGNSGWGTVFKMTTNVTSFAIVHNFTAPTGANFTNTDGAEPFGGLILSGNTLYGMTTQGGNSSAGGVFSVGTDGSSLTNLHSFAAGDYDSSANFTNSDGANPQDSLLLAGNTLYGTTADGGAAGYGTIFSVNTNGSAFTVLHSFTATSTGTNSDGANPQASLILSGTTLYGTALNGGSFGAGTVFAINTNGTGFEILHAFTADAASPPYGNSEGSHPAGLILSGNTLYGTASQGGINGNGTVFSISFAPKLTISPSAANVILTWPTNLAGFDYSGFTLQSTTNLASSGWSNVVPGAVIINGKNTVTNFAGTQNFYRLSQ